MLDKLFSSKARVEMLRLFLLHGDDKFYQNQIATLTSLPVTAVVRELKLLSSIDAINKTEEGLRAYYSINKDWAICKPMRDIFLKQIDVSQYLQKNFKEKNILFSFIYGSYASGSENKDSDLDIFVIGNISAKELSTAFSGLKKNYYKEINYMLMTKEEFQNKLNSANHFVTELMKSKKIFLVGGNDDFVETFGIQQNKKAQNF